MSIACNRLSLQQECGPSIPAEDPLTGDETLDDFVQKIRLREKSKAKRDQLPDLAPSAEVDPKPSAFLRQLFNAVTGPLSDTGCGRGAFAFGAQRQ